MNNLPTTPIAPPNCDGYYAYPEGENGYQPYQPYQPYYDYNSPYGGYGQGIVPPIVVVPPLIANPVPPLPTRTRRLRDGSYITEPDPHFHHLYTPPYPNFQAGGVTIYPIPQYYYPPYPPYPYGAVPPPHPWPHHR